MALPRESAFLPTIKCSTCSRQIEISMMGEHVCSEADADIPPLPPTKFGMPIGNSLSDKYDRMPPSLDTNAANGNFFRQGQLTPVSASSGSRSLSPRTPDSRAVGGRGNDFLEPSIASDNDSTYSQSRRPGGYGALSRRDEYDDPPFPLSPNKQPSFFSRMDNMAPGPFNAGRKGSAGNAFPPRGNAGYADERRPSTAASNRSMSGRDNGSSQRAPRKDGYGGLGRQDRFEPEPFKRAGTFPKPNDPIDAPARTPSAPGARRGRPQSKDVLFGMAPDTSRPPPPRKSLIRPVVPENEGIDLAAEFGNGNPYHTPSASMSSAITSYSQNSVPSHPSSQSSPPRSDGRKPSGASSIDDLMDDLQISMEGLQPTTPRLDLNPSIGPTRRGQTQVEDRYNSRGQNGSSYGQPFKSQDRPVFGGDMFGRSMDSYSSSPAPRGMDRERQGSASGASRGPCKACGEDIRGKCISSADGRLTGKYHKACFACTTCRSPFPSAEFYVLGDRPYCELHYHGLNGSLCGACGRGIEGQYLEDEASIKYHVGCFRCADCGMSLSNGYFEVDGGTYCERDAWRRAQGPLGASPEGGVSPASEYAPALAGVMSPMTPGFNRYAQGAPGPGPAPRGRGPAGVGLPQRPGNMAPPSATGSRRGPPMGLPRGQKIPPGTGPTPRPRMNKRNTRFGMM